MKIATWNLESKNPLTIQRESAFRNAILAVNADVWILTETWVNFTLMGYQLVAQTCRAEDLALSGRPSDRRWVAIWSRLKARSLEVLSDPERMACIRIEEGVHPVGIVGTVLPWRNDRRHPPIEGVAQADVATAEFCLMVNVQSKEWRGLWSSPSTTGFCVAGDFNMEMKKEMVLPRYTGSDKGYECLTKCLGETDIDGLECLTSDMEVVYPKSKNYIDPYPSIDHICVGGGLKLKPETQPETWDVPVIDKTAITDHAGVAADVVLSVNS